MEIIKVDKPIIPKSWDYKKSVEKVKTIVYKWKTITFDIAQELYVAREKLSSQGERTDLGANAPKWGTYCSDINVDKSTVNRWLVKWFPEKEKEKQLEKREAIENVYKKMGEIELIVKPALYGENIYFNSGEPSVDRWDDHIIKNDNYPTITRLSRFFHKDLTEFSLREYARVQDFPDSYKFVGNYSSIKSQIGNAVSPKMAANVGKNLKGKTFIDLFAGCGGLSCGLESIGKKSVFANEREKSYVATYIANHPNTKVSISDICNIDAKDIPDADIVVGGPPCQGFSSAGLKIKDDPRNKLYKEFLRIVKEKRPEEFLLENVPEIKNISSQIISDFKEIGYTVLFSIHKGEDIGMKQNRKRAFFNGIKI